MKHLARVALTLAVVCLPAAVASAAPIIVAGPSPVTPFAGTVIDFEGYAEGTLIDNEYAGVGVTFSQPGGGTPQIDTIPPPFFAYSAGSGSNALTGTVDPQAPFITVSGLIATFATPMSDVGAFMSDTAPLGNYTISAFGAGNVLLESFVVPGATLTGGCATGVSTLGCGAFVGFSRATADILAIQFGPSLASGDAFAIDDLRFVPEPALLSLLGLGLLVATRRIRRRE